jgi:hypothetical protein
VSVFVAVGAFELYSNAYAIPGPEFPVPTAPVWLNMARYVRFLSILLFEIPH